MLAELHREGPSAVIRLDGDLDLVSAGGVMELVANALTASETRQLTIDLDKLVYLDSSGLNVLLYAQNTCEQYGTHLTLLTPIDRVRRVLDITGVDAFFDIQP